MDLNICMSDNNSHRSSSQLIEHSDDPDHPRLISIANDKDILPYDDKKIDV